MSITYLLGTFKHDYDGRCAQWSVGVIVAAGVLASDENVDAAPRLIVEQARDPAAQQIACCTTRGMHPSCAASSQRQEKRDRILTRVAYRNPDGSQREPLQP